ncbi:helix-turn-helix domain-containing protein [Amycolatopsis umgeniensis]|uniref:Transcriptional regulator with XRE-family HTH domain n=1 Tax=Amycolatopsis umgeniensis TaxID=336628 RepID=A0A841BD01_9PSEU|nr:helix-turn-helix transcriptional regulator [Amycolatopsis umgeniensis]MBB5856374.1 transcriptional regulator with XRE-family HTH domain [Amycolatopsis umgeniensis]
MNTPTSEQLDQFAHALGELLRSARRERGWTRKQMGAAMGANEVDLSVQTLASYELGTRRISVERLIEVCAVLNKQPDELLLSATTLAFSGHYGTRITVDLLGLAHTTDPRLRSLRQWARVRIQQSPAAKRALVEELDATALSAMASIAETTEYDLVQALQELRAAHDRGSQLAAALSPAL